MTVITTTRLVTDLRVTKTTSSRGGGGDDNNVVNCLVCFISLTRRRMKEADVFESPIQT